MTLDPLKIHLREKAILAGLYLSKYDAVGLKKLGFENFTEAFNVIGYALGAKPGSVKNYRDEFDPFFPNRRAGWHKRPARKYCLNVFEQYKHLDLEAFTGLIKTLLGVDQNALSEISEVEEQNDKSSFAKRLITGLAAEKYFESLQPSIPTFKDHQLENTTRIGCGYDFRLRKPNEDFLAVEVKGLQDQSGTLSFTPREYEMAKLLTDRFFLFVVKNFSESPFHEVYQNPLFRDLRFAKKERVLVHVSWTTTV